MVRVISYVYCILDKNKYQTIVKFYFYHFTNKKENGKTSLIFSTAVSVCLYNRYVVTRSYKLQISDVPLPSPPLRKHASSTLSHWHLAALVGAEGWGASPKARVRSRLRTRSKIRTRSNLRSRLRSGSRSRSVKADVSPGKLKFGIKVGVTLGDAPTPKFRMDG